MIPRHQTILFVILLIVLDHAGRSAVDHFGSRPQTAVGGQASTPTQAPQVAPAEQATLMVANDADNSVTARRPFASLAAES